LSVINPAFYNTMTSHPPLMTAKKLFKTKWSSPIADFIQICYTMYSTSFSVLVLVLYFSFAHLSSVDSIFKSKTISQLNVSPILNNFVKTNCCSIDSSCCFVNLVNSNFSDCLQDFLKTKMITYSFCGIYRVFI
jgi:hypothetical protein